jgi:endonuclease/exonuclease/phosphatase family metal-dependent hydrolase
VTDRRLACLLVVLAAAAAPPAAPAQPDTVRVGSWNIEQLESPNGRFGDAKGIAQKPADLAAHIKASGVDVLALQEIGDNVDPGRRSTTMDAAFALLNAGGQDWTYELTANKVPADKTQLTGVAWNRKRVTQVGGVYRFPVQPVPGSSFNHWDRHPSAFKFSAGAGKTDFVVVSLHLKAGKSDGNKKQRKEEAEALRNELAGFVGQFKEKDVILIGDTNTLSPAEDAVSAITGAGFTDLNAGGATTVPWGNAPFDHIFLAAGRPAFAGAAMSRMVTDNEDQRKALSDHFLVYTDIKVLDDDDDNPPFGGGGTPGVPAGPAAGPAPASAVSILAVLPNPIGPDEEFESVTLANGSAANVSLAGWKLKDKADNVLNLSGQVVAAGTVSVRVRGNFTLNQGGDEVRLIDPAGQVVHKVSYTAAQVKPGKFITFGN